MPRPIPPMYAKVQRKVPPTGRKTTAVAPSEVAAEPPMPPAPAAPTEPDVEEEDVADEEEDSDGDEEDAESDDEDPDGGGESSSLSARQRKKLSKWSEEMSQRNLYKLAKSAGLDVRTRDAKEDLIQKIKDALG